MKISKWIFFNLLLIHWRLETPERVTGKQGRPRSDAAECGVWSGSPLFANRSTIFLQEYLHQIAWHILNRKWILSKTSVGVYLVFNGSKCCNTMADRQIEKSLNECFHNWWFCKWTTKALNTECKGWYGHIQLCNLVLSLRYTKKAPFRNYMIRGTCYK